MSQPTAPDVPTRGWALTVAEVALAALTLAAVVGFARVFTGWSWAGSLVAAAGGAHLLAVATRRAGWHPLIGAAASGAGLVLVASWMLLGDTLTWGLPTSATLDAAGQALSDSWMTFRTNIAPVPPEPGLVLASFIGVWVGAHLADTAAFRVGAPVEAAVPASTVFLFVAALAGDDWRIPAASLFLGALLLHALGQRLLRHSGSRAWLMAGTRQGWPTLARGAVGVGAVAVVVAVVLGPALPGADAGALVPWRARDRAGEAPRVTVSPLVDIRSRLVDQSNVEVFTVEADERAYWRLTSLETFDGRIWSSRRSYRRVDEGELPGDAATPSTLQIEQRFTIRELASIWLPVAYRPEQLVDAPDGVRFAPESGTLLTDRTTADGLTYTVRSAMPLPDVAQLEAAAVDDGQVDDLYRELPGDFSARVAEEAHRVVAGAVTPYDQALALQNYFRDGSFTYDQRVDAGHGAPAIERFLFETRRGYCEQFAGTYAAMARAVGLPARVAVGFTPGEVDDDGVFHVRGRNAHAWPEVHLAGIGWVAFEPTPGRGIPGAQSYTGVPEDQEERDAAAPATTDTTELPGLPDSGPAEPLDPGIPDFGEFATGGGGVGELGQDPPSPWPGRLRIAALAVLLGGVGWAVGLAAVKVGRRVLRRRGATSPGARVRVAWAEATEALRWSGVPRLEWETPTEYATRATRAARLDPALLGDLAAAVTVADFAADDRVPDDVARRAGAASREVERALRRRAGTRQRVRHAVDPRPLLPPPRDHLLVARR